MTLKSAETWLGPNIGRRSALSIVRTDPYHADPYHALGETPQPLDVLTGNPAYKGEFAYKDRWEELGGSHYCGKIRPDSTEILTMGVPRLHRDPERFAREDPEYFSFVVKTVLKWK